MVYYLKQNNQKHVKLGSEPLRIRNIIMQCINYSNMFLHDGNQNFQREDITV